MRLKYNVISQGRYFRAGEDIPDDLLSDVLHKYEVPSESTDSDEIMPPAYPRESTPRKRVTSSFVKGGNGFVPAAKVEVIRGEALYWHRKRTFGVDEKFIVFGRAGSE